MCVYTSAGSLSLLLTKLWDHHCSFQTISITSKRKKPHAPLFSPPPPSTFDTDSRFLTSLATPAMFPNTGAPPPAPPPPRSKNSPNSGTSGLFQHLERRGWGEGRLLCWESGGGGAARDTRSTLNPLPFASLPSGVS